MSFSDHSNGFVWKRAIAADNEDVWDDKALIDAYDRAVKEVNRRIADKNNEMSVSEKDKSVPQSWHCGQYCRCNYSEDGLEYEAQILSIDTPSDTCLVRYIGYGNQESKVLSQLKPSLGKRARTLQMRQSGQNEETESDLEYNNIYESHTARSGPNGPIGVSGFPRADTQAKIVKNDAKREWRGSHVPEVEPMAPIAPPPLPTHSDLPSDDESLASMLMSWYMSGYHTGYYRYGISDRLITD